MENAVEALKIAFAVMMFVLALTLSISSFSSANSAVTSLISMNDRENEYTYVEPTEGLTRTVGIETVVASMYRAMEQNIEIYFKKSSGDLISLCKKTQIDIPGYIVKDSNGNHENLYSIDLSTEAPEYKYMYIDILLAGYNEDAINDLVDEYLDGETKTKKDAYKEMYKAKLKGHEIGKDGIYKVFKDKKFTEEFGEYYQGTGASQIKKRVITYTIQDN